VRGIARAEIYGPGWWCWCSVSVLRTGRSSCIRDISNSTTTTPACCRCCCWHCSRCAPVVVVCLVVVMSCWWLWSVSNSWLTTASGSSTFTADTIILGRLSLLPSAGSFHRRHLLLLSPITDTHSFYHPGGMVKWASAFGLSNNKWRWWTWFPSSLQAGQRLKSVRLVQRSAAIWRCSAFITWTGWTLAKAPPDPLAGLRSRTSKGKERTGGNEGRGKRREGKRTGTGTGTGRAKGKTKGGKKVGTPTFWMKVTPLPVGLLFTTHSLPSLVLRYMR